MDQAPVWSVGGVLISLSVAADGGDGKPWEAAAVGRRGRMQVAVLLQQQGDSHPS